MNIQTSAKYLAELGHPTRLEILRYLAQKSAKGIPVGELQHQLQIPASTLSHHINRLINVGLLEQKREGRVLLCSPKYDELATLLDFLSQQWKIKS